MPRNLATTDRVERDELLEFVRPRHRVTLVTTDGPGGSERSVIDVDRGVLGLTLATDLMTLDRPTVERPAPGWPWSPERWGLLAMVVIVAGFAAAGWWVRRWFLR